MSPSKSNIDQNGGESGLAAIFFGARLPKKRRPKTMKLKRTDPDYAIVQSLARQVRQAQKPLADAAGRERVFDEICVGCADDLREKIRRYNEWVAAAARPQNLSPLTDEARARGQRASKPGRRWNGNLPPPRPKLSPEERAAAAARRREYQREWERKKRAAAAATGEQQRKRGRPRKIGGNE